MTLEVRVSNEVAKQLYKNMDFKMVEFVTILCRQSGRWSCNVGEYIMEKYDYTWD